jgi:lysozyme
MSKITSISDKFLQLSSEFECSGHPEKFLKAYQDTGKVWTIGIGTTRYPDGSKVKEHDTITLAEAYEYRGHEAAYVEKVVDALTTDAIEQHQFDALVDLVYNIGEGAYKHSTVRRVINNNPKDYKNIVPAFLMWKYDEGRIQAGLVRRRKAEAYLYVYGDLKFNFSPTDNII